jgi:hypothetical protein
MKLGEGDRPRRSLRQILDAAAESVSQPPEPAAADGLARIRLLADMGKHVEQRKRVGRRVGDGHRTRADDRTPARPVTCQRKRKRVIGEREQHILRRQPACERHPL